MLLILFLSYRQPNKKRQAKNKKFGFGGQKKRSKRNSKESLYDAMSGPRPKNKKKPQAQKQMRPGKSRRQKTKNKKK